jgi:hypothetical protein
LRGKVIGSRATVAGINDNDQLEKLLLLHQKGLYEKRPKRKNDIYSRF